MKKLLVILIILSASTRSNSQTIDNWWLMGYGNSFGIPYGATNLNFVNNNYPTINYDSTRTLWFDFAGASMNDTAGNLLFYTNGFTVCNRFNQVMPNGDTLSPSAYTASAYDGGLRITSGILCIPKPLNANSYFLIHETDDDATAPYPNYLYLSEVDMNADSGRGDLILKNQIIFTDTLGGGQILACKHANGRDWWVIAPERLNSAYYTILITPDTNNFYIQKNNIGSAGNATLQGCFSPDGSRYASYDTYTDLEVYEFDRCTGIFSNPQHVSINDNMVGGGVSFSPDGTKIYCSSTIYLYQFDLNAPNLAASQTLVAEWDSFYSPSPPFATVFFTHALRPDGKIYITTGNTTLRMHTIDFPDSAGLACQVSQHSVILPTFNSSTCPTFPNYYLGPVVGSICDSLAVGIAENTVNSAELSLNPNPATDQVWINYHFPNNRDGWLEIYDTVGKLVLKRRLYWSTTQLLLYTNDFKNGMYIVKVTDDTKMFSSVGKLVKN